MKFKALAAAFLLAAVTSLAAAQTNTPTATVTRTPTSTATPTITLTPTRTPTATFTATFTPTITLTPTASNTPTRTPTKTPTITKTPSRTPTATFTSTATPTITNTPTITRTPSVTPVPPPSTSFANELVAFNVCPASLTEYTSTGGSGPGFEAQSIVVQGYCTAASCGTLNIFTRTRSDFSWHLETTTAITDPTMATVTPPAAGTNTGGFQYASPYPVKQVRILLSCTAGRWFINAAGWKGTPWNVAP